MRLPPRPHPCRRKDKRRPVETVDDDSLLETYASHEPSAEAVVSERLTTEQALALIGTLPREQAEVVLLRVVVGLDTNEVCRIVGIPQVSADPSGTTAPN